MIDFNETDGLAQAAGDVHEPAGVARAAKGPRPLPPLGVNDEVVLPVTRDGERIRIAPAAAADAKDAKPQEKESKRGKKKAAAPAIKTEVTAGASARELDPTKLSQEKAAKNLGRIYKLERAVSVAQIRFDHASMVKKLAKEELDLALEALCGEIDEQRSGPGPLFNADGSGPAGAPQEDGKKPKGAKGSKGAKGAAPKESKSAKGADAKANAKAGKPAKPAKKGARA